MSKMSQLHAELTERAAELGFASIDEAEANGYSVNYKEGKLEQQQELAHQAWLAKRNDVLANLYALKGHFVEFGEHLYANIVSEAINFIQDGEQ